MIYSLSNNHNHPKLNVYRSFQSSEPWDNNSGEEGPVQETEKETVYEIKRAKLLFDRICFSQGL